MHDGWHMCRRIFTHDRLSSAELRQDSTKYAVDLHHHLDSPQGPPWGVAPGLERAPAHAGTHHLLVIICIGLRGQSHVLGDLLLPLLHPLSAPSLTRLSPIEILCRTKTYAQGLGCISIVTDADDRRAGCWARRARRIIPPPLPTRAAALIQETPKPPVVYRPGGRGGAGSRPRKVKPQAEDPGEEKEFKFPWHGKGKARAELTAKALMRTDTRDSTVSSIQFIPASTRPHQKPINPDPYDFACGSTVPGPSRRPSTTSTFSFQSTSSDGRKARQQSKLARTLGAGFAEHAQAANLPPRSSVSIFSLPPPRSIPRAASRATAPSSSFSPQPSSGGPAFPPAQQEWTVFSLRRHGASLFHTYVPTPSCWSWYKSISRPALVPVAVRRSSRNVKELIIATDRVIKCGTASVIYPSRRGASKAPLGELIRGLAFAVPGIDRLLRRKQGDVKLYTAYLEELVMCMDLTDSGSLHVPSGFVDPPHEYSEFGTLVNEDCEGIFASSG
ncbi:hypothetical protein DFH09DRAFT_1483961 [Mycena vulgaris]|nr:hypothetical protein DFH09DRAFT_1483961 [Mycena vulgaris]